MWKFGKAFPATSQEQHVLGCWITNRRPQICYRRLRPSRRSSTSPLAQFFTTTPPPITFTLVKLEVVVCLAQSETLNLRHQGVRFFHALNSAPLFSIFISTWLSPHSNDSSFPGSPWLPSRQKRQKPTKLTLLLKKSQLSSYQIFPFFSRRGLFYRLRCSNMADVAVGVMLSGRPHLAPSTPI